jgi:hypothetical protein
LGAKLGLKENPKSNNCYFGAIKKVKFLMLFRCKAPATKGNTYYIYRGVVRLWWWAFIQEEHKDCVKA